MLHEILYALIGHTGDVIIFQDDKFIVNPALYRGGNFSSVGEDSDVLSASEAELINKIVSLGSQFRLLKQFLDRYSGLSSSLALHLAYGANEAKKKERKEQDVAAGEEAEEEDEESEQLSGVYIKAFCSGVNELLTVYQEHVLAIEQEYLQDRALTVLSLQQKFGIYFQMFPALLNLMFEIEEQSKRGGEILNALHQKCTSGNPIIKNMFAKILFCCHRVFYHQLNAWIVHGQLVDICEEFFIHKINFSGAASGVKNTALANENEKQMNVTKLSVNTVSNVNMIGQILANAAENFGATDDFGELDNSNIENEWNISYTLRISMLPHSYIGATIANKILFIGKAVRVLQSKRTKQEDRIPLEELQAFSEAIMKMSKISEFNVILFSKIIEEIRECVASRLWHLVVIKADLQAHLKTIKDFFLLSRGEFFQTFLQESRHIMSLPPRTSAQDDLNMGPLITTVSKLRLEDDDRINKFKLKLRSFSFQFKDFSTLTGLVYDGDIRFDQQSNVLRITSTKNSTRSGCLWHSLKQRIDLGFKTSFAFKFVNPLAQNQRKGLLDMNQSMVSGSMLGTPRDGPKQGTVLAGDEYAKGQGKQYDAAVAFIIQNEKEVIPWKKKTPISTQDLNQFVAIKFITKITVQAGGAKPGQQANRLQLQGAKPQITTTHFVQVVASAETNIGKIRNIIDDQEIHRAKNKTEVILAEQEIPPDDINFMENHFNQCIIDYNKENDELKVSFMDTSAHLGNKNSIMVKDPVIKMQLKLTDFISLDNGSAFLGFTHETTNLYNRLFLKNWSFTSSYQSNKQDPWSGLSLDYQVEWPLHLIFGSDTIEKYNQLFRFLLPIKRVQIELQNAWQVKVKTMKHMSDNELFRQAMHLRQHMSFLVDNIYSYLQTDVLEACQNQLLEGLKNSTDFEEVCNMHDNHIQQLIEQCFLNYAEVLKAINDVLYVSQKLCKFLSQMDEEQILENEDFPVKFQNIKNNFELLSNKIFTTLSSYKNRSHRSSPQLAQLLLRFDYNDYFSLVQEKFEYAASQSMANAGNYGYVAGY